MKISVLGTGMVGQTIAPRLIELGHKVIMGTRNPEETKGRTNPNQMTGVSFAHWYKDHPDIKLVTLPQVAQGADLVINATSGTATLEVLKQVGKENLAGKVLLDIANPLDFSKGMPPTLSVCNTDSLGEQVQANFPQTKVVKSLNTMNATIMIHPELVPGDHNVFVSGNHPEAKQLVTDLLKSFGWKEVNIIDLGDISSARGTEMLLPIWLRLWGTLGHANYNFHIQRKK